LTTPHRIKPTSTSRHSAWRPNPGRRSTYQPGESVQTTGTSSDIPRFITNYGDTIGVGDFYAGIYNATPAHMLDINSAIIDNPDLEVITEDGGERRKANTIRVSDTLRLKHQRSFFPIFFTDQTKKDK
jgi:hypothetical protein